VSQLRQVLTALLREPHESLQEIAARISGVLRRTEEARIYYWYDRAKTFPPPRGSQANRSGP
jgi:hypothetical protein